MTTAEKQIELYDKILVGFDMVYEKLIEFKKQKKHGTCRNEGR